MKPSFIYGKRNTQKMENIFPLEAKTMLFGILLNKLLKFVEELFKYTVTVARNIYMSKWK